MNAICPFPPPQVRLGSRDPQRTCCNQCISHKQTHAHTLPKSDDFQSVFRTTCLQSFVLLQPRESDYKAASGRESPQPAHVQTHTPARRKRLVCASQWIHINTQHFRQPPDGVGGFCKAARVAVSNTSQIPSLVLAEHSK